MRPGALAAVSLVSAVLGGAGVLLLGRASGWTDRPAETVVAELPAVSASDPPPAPPAASRPLAGNGFDPARIYAARADGVVTVYALFGEHPGSGSAGQGSGFVVSRDGLVLTSAHVITNAGEAASSRVEAASETYVEFRDGERIPARVVGWDVFNDVGVLRIDPDRHRLAPLPLGDSSRVTVGEPVAAIGSPFGEQGSLAVGVVSATRRSIAALTSGYAIVDAIQIDAPINRGNSGGPLFDARGRVIGINAQIRSTTGTAEGVGFAVPINSARRSLEQLLRRGRVAYAYVGISTLDLTPSVARRLGVAATRGALVVEVEEGPGRRAGLRAGSRTLRVAGREVQAGGDVIVGVDGIAVRSRDDLVRIISERLRPGQVARFRVVRGDRELLVPIRLAERPVDPGRG